MRCCIAATAGWIFLTIFGLCALSPLANAQDLTITSTHTGSFQLGQTNAYYLLRVKNVGSAPSSGYVSVGENAPAGLTVTSMLGDGWTCTVSSCGRSDALATGASYPAIMVVTSVAPSGGSSLTNQATVTGGGDANIANNTVGDVTTVAANGYPVAWGRNDSDQSTLPTGLSNVVAIAAGGRYTLGLRIDGTVVAWGDNTAQQTIVPAGLSHVVAIEAGEYHSLALKSDGTVAAWGAIGSGFNVDYGQTTVPSGLSNVVAISAGDYHSLALKSDGTVVAWGRNQSGQTTIPAGLSSVVAISAGYYHSLALRSDGTVVAWGDNSYGETNVPAGLTNVVAIAAGVGALHSLVLKSDGTVVTWGDNSFGAEIIPPGLSGVVAIAAGPTHNLALKSDGTVVAWTALSLNSAGLYGETTVPTSLSGVVAISAGFESSLALLRAAPTTIPIGFAKSGNIGQFHVLGELSVDGIPYSGGVFSRLVFILDWTPGSSHTISSIAGIDEIGGLARTIFSGWSDGGALTHVVTPSVPTTYTVTFNDQDLVTTAVNPSGAGAISPTTGFFDDGTSIQIVATPTPGYAFTGFSGGLTGMTNPQNLKVTYNGASVTANFVPVTPPLINPSFELGLITQTSFTGTGNGGPSVASSWYVWNSNPGTTKTELCTAGACPSGSVPPAPVDGVHTLHVTTTGASSGVYQVFPKVALTSASVWLKVVSGSVLVELLGPAGNVVKTTTGTGVVWLPTNSAMFTELVLYSYGGAAEFYADLVNLSSPRLSLLSPAFGPAGTVVTLTGTGFGAAKGTSTITFHGTAATPSAWSNSSIQVSVPNGATTGYVVVTVNGQPSNGISFTVTPRIVTNPSFELGSSVPVSFTGTGNGGASAATGWRIWNNYPGTTTTELCTATSCPSGSIASAPVAGTHTMHITTTGPSSGIYQILPQGGLEYGSLWLGVAKGTVLIELLGPGGPIVRTTSSSGVIWLPTNGGVLNEIVIYSYGSVPAEFYVDAVTLIPSIGIMTNPSFELGSFVPVSFTGTGDGGTSAATGWRIWNNYPGTTKTERCTATIFCPSGSIATAPVAGTYTMHVTTTGASSGVYQMFPQAALEYGSVWLSVVSGTVLIEMLGPGGAIVKTASTSGVIYVPINGAVANEIVIYSWGGPAEFYVDAVAVTP